jgi:hypothetical protein
LREAACSFERAHSLLLVTKPSSIVPNQLCRPNFDALARTEGLLRNEEVSLLVCHYSLSRVLRIIIRVVRVTIGPENHSRIGPTTLVAKIGHKSRAHLIWTIPRIDCA